MLNFVVVRRNINIYKHEKERELCTRYRWNKWDWVRAGKTSRCSGYNIIVVARHENDLIRVSNEIKENHDVDVVLIAKDLFNPENAFELYNQVKTKNIVVEILINDAGQGVYGEFKDTDLRRELDIINLNISSLVILTKLFLKEMVARGSGRIMNLSSVASKIPGPWQSVYHGTKAFVQSFTEAIRVK